jgi:hypothetical protein
MMTPRVLFILKRREDYDPTVHLSKNMKTGLANSVLFIEDMLSDLNIRNKVVIVTDNNDIDREVTQYKPTHVIIEALWVVPSKFAVLTKLHPQVKWIVRLHSEMPFIANEGVAMQWIIDYIKYPQVYVAANSPRMQKDLVKYARHCLGINRSDAEKKILLLTNTYPTVYPQVKPFKSKYIDIASFGAVRPLKNQLIQAQAALNFAETNGLKLRFHVNAGRIEQKGQPVLNNLKGMFLHAYERGHELICHDWLDRDDFLKLCSEIDIGLQVSFSETFNIVAADYISQGVPIVGSREIPWLFRLFAASPTRTASIERSIGLAWWLKTFNVCIHSMLLNLYCWRTKRTWRKYLQGA